MRKAWKIICAAATAAAITVCATGCGAGADTAANGSAERGPGTEARREAVPEPTDAELYEYGDTLAAHGDIVALFEAAGFEFTGDRAVDPAVEPANGACWEAKAESDGIRVDVSRALFSGGPIRDLMWYDRGAAVAAHQNREKGSSLSPGRWRFTGDNGDPVTVLSDDDAIVRIEGPEARLRERGIPELIEKLYA
jgi:hypothetical protein